MLHIAQKKSIRGPEGHGKAVGFIVGVAGNHGGVSSRDVVCGYIMDNKLQERGGK